MWPKFLSLATLAYNTFNSPNLGNYNLYELVFSRKPKVLLDPETDPDIKVSGTFKDYLHAFEQEVKIFVRYTAAVQIQVFGYDKQKP